MFEWIMQNPVAALCGLVIIVAIGVLFFVNRKDVILKSALYIVAKVEEEWGGNMGQIKFAEAYTYLKSKYPIVTFLLPEKLLTNIIETALVRLKEILATKASKEAKETEEKAKNEPVENEKVNATVVAVEAVKEVMKVAKEVIAETKSAETTPVQEDKPTE